MRTHSLAFAVSLAPLLAVSVTFRDTTIDLPTYRPGGYDKTPVFYTGRVYQGAQGRVYPYPMQDVLYDSRQNETYRYLTLENDWLRCGVLPEHGGRLHNLTDKATGFEAFYRQHVVKPALIGMLGAWTSGGVEWNFPHHHRPTTAMPVDWRVTEAEDGTPTLWLGETELRDRLKWTIGLTLLKDRAALCAENVFMNRGPFAESMLYWANVAAACGEDYQVVFPPSCRLGFDHHKVNWTTFPMGALSRQPGADGIVDLGWWKNFTVEPRSIFAMDPDNAWLAGYDHGRNAGTVHVSDRHVTVGKKFFLWGNYPAGHLWDSVVLTDADGPYVELMVGCWSDNQPDYSWIAPYETRRVKQYWYPVKGIGGVKEANVDGAVNVERRGKDELLVGFHSTRVLSNCTVRVVRGPSGGSVFEERNVGLGPNAPWCKTVKVPVGPTDAEFTVSVADARGKVFLSYTPVGSGTNEPLPSDTESPKPPADYAEAEKAYLVGLRLEQFHNGVVDPLPYYERALEIDPDYSAANVALGRHGLKRGDTVRAERHLVRAVRRVTQNYTRAKDAESEYLLACCRRAQGRFKEADDLFARASWNSACRREACVERARLALLRNDFASALEHLDAALERGSREAKTWTLKAHALRRLGRSEEAAACRRTACACDALEHWAVLEDAFAADGDVARAADLAVRQAGKNRGLPAQQLLESVCDYVGIGAWPEVRALCAAARRRGEGERPQSPTGPQPLAALTSACASYASPMFGYFEAAACSRLGDEKGAAQARTAASSAVGDYCFPSRLEELAVLEEAVRAEKVTGLRSAKTAYYLGEILWNLDRKDEATVAWREAVALAPDDARALRCLAFALTHPGTCFDSTGTPNGIASEEGLALYRRAVAADPSNARTLLECDVTAERGGASAIERLLLLRKWRKTVDGYDPCFLRLVRMEMDIGNFTAAAEMMTGRRFHVWEGGGGLHDVFVEALVGRGRIRRAAGDAAGARADFERALTYPLNLEEARPADGGTDPLVWWELAELERTLGREDARRTALGKAVAAKARLGEMNFYRAKALRALGREAEVAAEVESLLRKAEELERPWPRVVSAYIKFGGEMSADERTAVRRTQAAELRRMAGELTGRPNRPVLPLDVWTEVTTSNGVCDVVYGRPRNESDCSFRFRVTRRDGGLGVEAYVRDDRTIADSARLGSDVAETWADDCIEIFFDGDNDCQSNTRGPDLDHPRRCQAGGEYALAANGAHQSLCASLTNGFGRLWGGTAEAWTEKGERCGTHYLLWFDWTCLNRPAPKPGEEVRFGFTICVHDDDDGGACDRTLYWQGNPRFPFADERAFGEVVVPPAVPVMLDTDIGPDFDDVGAMAVLHSLADAGEARILATVACNRTPLCVPVIEIINAHYGRPDVPVGCVREGGLSLDDDWHVRKWPEVLAGKYAALVRHARSADAPAACDVYRRVLAAAPDGSVTVCSIGFLTNLADLLVSRPDAVSELSGRELVRRKVSKLVSMAGYAGGGREFNVMKDAVSAKRVFAEWPTPIVISPAELGSQIRTGKRLVAQTEPASPVRDAFAVAMAEKDGEGRQSWDEATVYAAVRGGGDLFAEERGRFAVADAAGTNIWTPDASGPHVLLRLAVPAQKAADRLESLMMRPARAIGPTTAGAE